MLKCRFSFALPWIWSWCLHFFISEVKSFPKASSVAGIGLCWWMCFWLGAWKGIMAKQRRRLFTWYLDVINRETEREVALGDAMHFGCFRCGSSIGELIEAQLLSCKAGISHGSLVGRKARTKSASRHFPYEFLSHCCIYDFLLRNEQREKVNHNYFCN